MLLKNSQAFRKELEVFDTVTNETKNFPSISEAAKFIGCSSSAIYSYLSRNTNKPYRKRYVLKKT